MSGPTIPDPTTPDTSPTDSQRLVSWKEIAAYFNCDVRTVKRWERERGLPVHRVPGGERSRVFAYTEELRAWLHSAPREAASEAATPSAEAVEEFATAQDAPPEPAGTENELHARSQATRRSFPSIAILAAALMLAVIAGAFGFRRIRSTPLHNPAAATANAGNAPAPAARDLYLKGRYNLEKRTSESLSQAVDAYTQAIVLDSNYAEAYAGLAECYDLMPEYTGMSNADAMPRAIAAARKAISLNEALPTAHNALAFALYWYRWDFKDADAEFRRAIELDPKNVEAHHWYATALMSVGLFSDALREIDLAQQLDPASRSILADQAVVLYDSGDRKSAISKLDQLQHSEPDFLSPPHYLANIYFDDGNYGAYVSELKQIALVTRKDSDAQLAAAAERGWTQSGTRGLLEAIRSIYEKDVAAGMDESIQLAQICGRLGDREAAVRYLTAAWEVHDYRVRTALSDTWASQLNGYPPFEAIRARIRKLIGAGHVPGK